MQRICGLEIKADDIGSIVDATRPQCDAAGPPVSYAVRSSNDLAMNHASDPIKTTGLEGKSSLMWV